MPGTLTEIANKYGTDKGTVGPSVKWGGNNYTDIFEAYLERKRNSALVILEIGLGVKGDNWEAIIVHGRNSGGASLKMWYDYFPKARILGIDINECSYLDNDRITTYVADQGNLQDLERFLNEAEVSQFDLVIDDGSHRPDDQQLSFSYLFRKLKSGGLYFIENLFKNGLGDKKKGRMASDKYLNTRAVLKNYQKHGHFSEPNGLMDQEYLLNTIDYVGFYCPKLSIKYYLRPKPRAPFKKVIKYEPGSETLCAIVKK